MNRIVLQKYTKIKLKEICTSLNINSKGIKDVLITNILESTSNKTNLNKLIVPEKKEGFRWILSIDIGKNNFAFCIEEIDEIYFKSNKLVNKLSRSSSEDDIKKYRNEISNKVYKNGKIILIENVDITEDCIKGKFDNKIFNNLNKLLDIYQDFFEKCSTVIIEEQMSFGKKVNLTAIKLSQHTHSWFLIKIPSIKIHIFHSYYKTQLLSAPPKMNKPQRKKWAVSEGIKILEGREDSDTLLKMKERLKKDDLCDVIVQLQAYKIYILNKDSLLL